MMCCHCCCSLSDGHRVVDGTGMQGRERAPGLAGGQQRHGESMSVSYSDMVGGHTLSPSPGASRLMLATDVTTLPHRVGSHRPNQAYMGKHRAQYDGQRPNYTLIGGVSEPSALRPHRHGPRRRQPRAPVARNQGIQEVSPAGADLVHT